MHRTDGAGNIAGMYVVEDADLGRPPTEVTADHLNALQEELATLIEWAGLALSKADNTQVRQALLEKFALKSLAGILDLAQVWTKANRGAVVALADGVTVTPDFDLANNYTLTLGGNRTLANPTNLVAGQSGVITIKQDATGGRVLAFGSYWKFANGTAPSLTTAANAVDNLAYYVESPTRIWASLAKGVA